MTVMPYLKSTQIMRCPNDGGPAAATLTGKRVPISYAYNQALVRTGANSAGGGNNFTLKPLPAFTAPTKTVLCFEVRKGYFDSADPLESDSPVGSGTGLWGGNRSNTATALQYATGAMSNAVDAASNNNLGDPAYDPAHFVGSNFLCADGHVKYLQPDAVSSGYSASTPTSTQGGNYAEGTQKGLHALTFSTN